MNRIVLDASALLAILNEEPGTEKLSPDMLSEAISSTVNLAEVQGKLVARGLSSEEAWEATLGLVREAISFSPQQAKLAGDLITKTRALGLSLGDRACLALGLLIQAPVYTTDKSWKNVKLPIEVHLLR